MVPAVNAEVSSVSLPPRPSMASVSKASAWETLTVHGRPVSVAVPDDDLAREFQRIGLSVPATVRSAMKSPAVIGSGRG